MQTGRFHTSQNMAVEEDIPISVTQNQRSTKFQSPRRHRADLPLFGSLCQLIARSYSSQETKRRSSKAGFEKLSNRPLLLSERILRAVEGSLCVPWRGTASSPLDPGMSAIPPESHAMPLGRRTAVIVQTDHDLRFCESERTRLLEKQTARAQCFPSDARLL